MLTLEECRALAPEGWEYMGLQVPGRRNNSPCTVYCYGKDLTLPGTLKFFQCPEEEMTKEHLNLLASAFDNQGDE